MFQTLYPCLLGYIYGGFFALAIGLEGGRIPPLWNGQFKSFIPGDFFLGAGLAAGLILATRLKESGLRGWWQSRAWHVSTASVAAGVSLALFIFQVSDEERANPRLFFSPTRIWHQLAIWGPGLYVGLALVLPAAIWAVRNWKALSTRANMHTLLCLAGFAVWAAFMVYDGTNPPSIDPARPLHAPLDLSWVKRILAGSGD